MAFTSPQKSIEDAQSRGYAVGLFACRHPCMVQAVLETAEEERSPAILSISQLELEWFHLTPDSFLDNVAATAEQLLVSIPHSVHLDHAWDIHVMEQAVGCGFGSVLYDGSARPLYENLAKTREIADMCHSDGVLAMAELGTGAAERLDLQPDQLRTHPDEAADFVRASKCDCLAVSVGSSHGCYRNPEPALNVLLLERLALQVKVPLALHGAATLPAGQLRQATTAAHGGISLVNIGTEMELVMLEVLGRRERLSAREAASLPRDDIDRVLPALKALVGLAMREWLGSAGMA